MQNLAYLIQTHIPLDSLLAKRIAHDLLENGLAACVNISQPTFSMFRWKDEIQSDDELQLQIKTSVTKLEEATQMLEKLHPYDVPEIIVLPIVAGHQAYIDWINEETQG